MLGVLGFLLLSVPTAWSGFFSEPFYPWLFRHVGFGSFAFSLSWILPSLGGILLISIVWALFGRAITKFVHVYKQMSLIVFVLAFAAMGAAFWYAVYKLPWKQATTGGESKSKDAPVAIASSDAPKLPPTLHDLYTTDFSGFAHFNYGGELHAKAEDGHIEKVKVSYAVYMDFAANSRFISVYIESSPASYYACTQVPNFYNEILDEADKVAVTTQRPGDSVVEHSKELKFTGKIYIYYEDNLTLEQLGSLEALYKSKNLSPQFRGQNYATTMWLAAKASGSPIPSHSDKAQVDSIDALREEGRKLQRAFASPIGELPDDEPDRWLEKVQLFLRSVSRSYANRFDEILKDPQRHTGGGTSPAFTNEQMSQWENDPRRQFGWPRITAVLRYLDEVKKELYSKLP